MGAKVSQSTTNSLHPPHKPPLQSPSFTHKRPKPITLQAKSFLPTLSTTPNHLTTQSHLPTCYSLTPQAGSLSSLTSLQGPNKDNFYEIYLVGSSSVGKTSLINQYCHSSFDPCTAPTIGFDFKLQKVQTATRAARLRIWDTPRQGDLTKVMDSSCKGKRGFLMVYDVTDRESFDDLKLLMNELRKFGSLKTQSFLVGNKADDEKNRQVKFVEGEKLAENEGFKFFEVSAKNEENVQEIFQEMITGLVNYQEEESIEMNILDHIEKNGTRIEDIDISS